MSDHKPFGDSNEFDDADMAAVGRALIDTLNSNAGHSVLKGWAPAQCPSEIVVDLLNRIDEMAIAQAVGHQMEGGDDVRKRRI